VRTGASGGFTQTPIHEARQGVTAAPSQAPTEAGPAAAARVGITGDLLFISDNSFSTGLPVHKEFGAELKKEFSRRRNSREKEFSVYSSNPIIIRLTAKYLR